MNLKSKKNKIFKRMIDKLKAISTDYSVQFIIDRVNLKSYQGHTGVNHNRITVEKLNVFLNLLNEQGELKVPRGDSGKGKFDIRNYPEFEKFVNDFKDLTKQGTQNSIRKNLATDFARYGFIKRIWYKDGVKHSFVESSGKRVKVGVELFYEITQMGKQFLVANLTQKEKILEEAIKSVHGEKITLIYEILKEFDAITFFEYLMFINKPNPIDLCDSVEESVKLIKSWRKLSRAIKEGVQDILKKCDPKEQLKINKKFKFDYQNWINDTKQLLDSFKKVYLFKISTDYDFNVTKTKLGKKIRNKKIYKTYNKLHKIDKKKGYEYHHIIPLYKAETEKELIMVDDYKNLIYIDAGVHAEFTQTGNPFLILEWMNNQQIKLLNALKTNDYSIDKEKALYDYSLFEEMKEHNSRILYEMGY